VIGGIERGEGERTDGQAAKQADNARPVDRTFADLGTDGIGERVRGCEVAKSCTLALYRRISFFLFGRVCVCMCIGTELYSYSVDPGPDWPGRERENEREAGMSG